MAIQTAWRFGAAFLTIAAMLGQANAAQKGRSAAMLPDRMLQCQIRHITNFDPGLNQTAQQLQFDRVHSFALFLPAIRVRTSAPPEAFEKPEPVNPRTRIISDPDGIAPQPGHKFDKLVDYWPDRVELASTISGPLLNVIVIHPIDPVSGTANLFMTRASELTHFDNSHIYQGSCTVHAGRVPRAKI